MDQSKETRPVGVKAVVVLLGLIAVVTLPMAATVFYIDTASAAARQFSLFMVMGSLVGVLALAAAFGIWWRAKWSRVVGIVVFLFIGVQQFIALVAPFVTMPHHVWSDLLRSEIAWKLLLSFGVHAGLVIVCILVIRFLLKPETGKYFQRVR